MGDVFLFVVAIVALSTVWIEWLPRKYDILIGVAFSIIIIGIGIDWMPKWYGWVVLVLGFADLAWQYRKGVHEFSWPPIFDLSERFAGAIQSSLGIAASFFGKARKLTTRTPAPDETAAPVVPQPRTPRRVWVGGIALTALSPITAIPAAIMLAMVLTIANSMLLDAGSLEFSSTLKSVLGNAFMIQVASLDLVFRGFLLTGPLFLFAGVRGAKWADQTGSYWRRLLKASLLVGALYPSLFIIADTMGWFDEPLFT